jgi:hypothetical protein
MVCSNLYICSIVSFYTYTIYIHKIRILLKPKKYKYHHILTNKERIVKCHY